MRYSTKLITYTVLIALVLGIVLVNPHWIEDVKQHIKNYIQNKNTENNLWDKGFEFVEIASSLDNKKQKAYFYPSTSKNPSPLVVSLHTWGGNYQEYDSIALFSKEKNLNYIHPDFRGANSTPDACNSQKSLRDIDDAIDFVIKNANVDRNKIYIIGKSGGGYAAIGAYMKSKHPIHTVSSWVPITDISKWYAEGLLKKSQYTEGILKCTSSENGILNQDKAKEKSPIFWPTPTEKRKHTKLHIYTGVYDGLNGSVPITHSIDFYNKVISDFGAKDSTNYVTQYEKLFLLEKRSSLGDFGKTGNRQTFLKKNYQNIQLSIFNGHHEMLTAYAFNALMNP